MSSVGPGLILAAPSSGSGKTVVTLALSRALTRRGVAVAGVKAGPDYIDPAFHEAACGRACVNIDTWAMGASLVASLAARQTRGMDLVLAEGVMGLFDGALGVDAPLADGSAASLAARTGWPVVLVVDCRGMGASVAALVSGFARHRADCPIVGVILNRVGSDRHLEALTQAIAQTVPEIRVLGGLPHRADLVVPERHLGLVQAREHPALDRFLEAAADCVAEHLDLDALVALARPIAANGNGESRLPLPPSRTPWPLPPPGTLWPLPPPGQRIALALDDAFAFTYDAVLAGWRAAGAELLPFSPLADQGPDGSADAIYLPGGYPELQAGRLADSRVFLGGLRAAAARGVTIFGECGGYMVLGRSLTDAQGRVHAMAGLLPVDTSFAQRKRHLGYRRASMLASGWWGAAGEVLSGHEFHYASVTADSAEDRLYALIDAQGRDLGAAGHRKGTVAGGFVHLISQTE
ncbi:cobyrinate a,c-diamide synthase [Rhodospirillum sp. A1_3_36]|uniref:cobyrinate a,c-diamide synthase n=1 Tax=Rhodospirillum sp. A1_3_36 TaxID=3391666 RepID=UPI0039A6BC20